MCYSITWPTVPPQIRIGNFDQKCSEFRVLDLGFRVCRVESLKFRILVWGCRLAYTLNSPEL